MPAVLPTDLLIAGFIYAYLWPTDLMKVPQGNQPDNPKCAVLRTQVLCMDSKYVL